MNTKFKLTTVTHQSVL